MYKKRIKILIKGAKTCGGSETWAVVVITWPTMVKRCMVVVKRHCVGGKCVTVVKNRCGG